MRQAIIDLLKRVSRQLGHVDDGVIANHLKVPRRDLPKWRAGLKPMDERVAREIAAILGENPDLLACDVAAVCATDPRVQESYARLAASIRSVDGGGGDTALTS